MSGNRPVARRRSAVRTCAESKPRSTWRSRTKLRRSKVDPMSSISVSATCAAISQPLDREVEDVLRMEVFRVSITSSFRPCNAGSTLVPKAASSDTAVVNRTTGPPNAISSTRGMSPGASATRSRVPQYPSAIPDAPPTAAITAVSAKRWRSSLPVPAPSAMRTAVSCRRDEIRASMRFVTFAQAINNTQPTTPRSINSATLTWPTVASSRPSTRTPYPAFDFGNSVASAAAMAASSARASPMDLPSRSRATDP